MGPELPNWVARFIGASMAVVGLVLCVHPLSIFIGVPMILMGLWIGLSKKHVPKRKCPFCAERVKREAKVCKWCQRDLPALARGA